jgi:hypothetical protein
MTKNIIWGTLAMALVAALAYILMGAGVLTPGNLDTGSGGGIAYLIGAAYFAMAACVVLKWRAVRIVEAFIVLFTIVVFYGKYAGQPDVMWSAPGLITKIAQVLMLAGLLYLIFKPAPKITK